MSFGKRFGRRRNYGRYRRYKRGRHTNDIPANDPTKKDTVRNNLKSILAVDDKLRSLASRLRGQYYRFQLKGQFGADLATDGTPTVICLSAFASFRPIFQARDDSGLMNKHITDVNKVRAGVSGINYSINIDDASMPMFSVSVFFVKLKKTAVHMVSNNTPGTLEGQDLINEKDISVTPLTGNASKQFVMLNKNEFKILYHKRHILGRYTSPLFPTGEDLVTVTNRRDTTIDKYYKLKHDKIYKAPYGNGWLSVAGAEPNQDIAGRPYMIIVPQNMTGNTGTASFLLQQVTTFKTLA